MRIITCLLAIHLGSILHLSSALPPQIDAIMPGAGTRSSQVTFQGANFSTNAMEVMVHFGRLTATVVSASASRVVVTVPLELPLGRTETTIVVGGQTSHPIPFEVLPAITDVTLTLTEVASNHLQLSWPIYLTNMILESTERLTTAVPWKPVASQPVIAGDQFRLPVAGDKPQQIYRLASSVLAEPSFPVVLSATGTINASSGGVIQLGNGASITIPAGALTNDVTITFSELDLSPFSAGVARRVYRVDAGGIQLQKPAVVVLPYGQIPPGNTTAGIHVLRDSADEGNVELPVQVDQTTATVRVATDRFSLLVVEHEASYLGTFLRVKDDVTAGALLSVPYYCQGETMWCFAAASQMMMKHYGVDVEAWDVARHFGVSMTQAAPIYSVYAGNYRSLYEKYGLEVNELCSWIFGPNINGYLIQQLDAGRPVFIIVEHGSHALVVVGYDSTGVYIHDPSGHSIQTVTGHPPDPQRLATRKCSWPEWTTAMFAAKLGWTINIPMPIWTITLKGTPAPPNPPVTFNLISALLNGDVASRGCLEVDRPLSDNTKARTYFIWDGTEPSGYQFYPGPFFLPSRNLANTDEMELYVYLYNAANVPHYATLQANLDGHAIFRSDTPASIGSRTSLEPVVLFPTQNAYRFIDGAAGLLVPGWHELRLELFVDDHRVDWIPMPIQIGPARPKGVKVSPTTGGMQISWDPNPEEVFAKLNYRVFADGINLGFTDKHEYIAPSGYEQSPFTVSALHTLDGLESPPSFPVKYVLKRYALDGINWSYRRESPPWASSNIVAQGKSIAIPNPQGRGVVTILLNLPDIITLGHGFTSTFSVATTNAYSPQDIAILGWGDSSEGTNSRIEGSTNPVNLVHFADWQPATDGLSTWTTTVTATPQFKDGTKTKTKPVYGMLPYYPLFRVGLGSNGSSVLSAEIRWKEIQP